MSNINHKIEKYSFKLGKASGDKKQYYETKLNYYKKQRGGDLFNEKQVDQALTKVFEPIATNQSDSINAILIQIDANIAKLKEELKQKSDVISRFYEEYVKLKAQLKTMNTDALNIIALDTAPTRQQNDPLRRILDDTLKQPQQ